MSKAKGEVRLDMAVRLSIRMMIQVLESVAVGDSNMADGRESMRKWWEAIGEEQKRLLAPVMMEKLQTVRNIGDAVFQEFSTISAPFRN